MVWATIMYAAPLFGFIAFLGVPIRTIQLLRGTIQRDYQNAGPKAQSTLQLALIPAFFVALAIVNATYAVYDHMTCTAGAGCAQGEFGVVFSFGLLGIAYVALEILLLPLAISTRKVRDAQF